MGRFEGIQMVSLPTTELWFGWGMLLMVVLFGLIATSTPGFITEKFKLMFADQDRRTFSSMAHQMDGKTMIWSTLFTVLSLSMSLFVCIPSDGGYGFSRYGMFIICLLALLLGRMLVMWFLSIVFGGQDYFEILFGQYNRILFTTAILSCISLFVYLVLPVTMQHRTWVMLPAAIFYSVILLWHFSRNFSINLYVCIYLLLYLLTVEILPMFIIINQFSKQL